MGASSVAAELRRRASWSAWRTADSLAGSAARPERRARRSAAQRRAWRSAAERWARRSDRFRPLRRGRPRTFRARPRRIRTRAAAGPGGPPPVPAVFAPVVVDSETIAMVGVTSEPRPLSFVIRDLGPTLGTSPFVLLLAGTSIGALLIFRPTHRRLRSLQDAARAIGEGREGVRAVASGGDEVANLALAFNEMAGGLEQRTHALVAADESRRQLLADVSHELMTPLAAIRGYVETMAMADLKLDEPTRQRYLQIVGDETERMEHIIGDLLDLGARRGWGRRLEARPGFCSVVVRARVAPARPGASTQGHLARAIDRARRRPRDRRFETAGAGGSESRRQRRPSHARWRHGPFDRESRPGRG